MAGVIIALLLIVAFSILVSALFSKSRKCNVCGHTISKRAQVCPKCGDPK